ARRRARRRAGPALPRFRPGPGPAWLVGPSSVRVMPGSTAGGAAGAAAGAWMGGSGGGEAAGADLDDSLSLTRASAGGVDTVLSTVVPDWVEALVETTGAGGFVPPHGGG